MRPGPVSLVRILLETFPLDAPPVPIVELLTQIILERKWETVRVVAREKAERWMDPALNRLRTEINQLLEIGRVSRISFNSSSNYMVQGACFIEPRDPEDLRDRKQRRLRSETYSQILTELTPEQFENLCGKLIELLGVEKAYITRRSADEGIDFFGKLSFESIFFPQDLTPTIQKQLSIWVVGQAKRHIETHSGTPEIRDLVGAINLGRSRAFGSAKSPFPDLRIRVVDPVFSLLITTGRISANAWKLMERSGVIGMDGEMVAAFLADREVGIISRNMSMKMRHVC